MPTLRIERKDSYYCKVRRYKILLDGIFIGHIGNNETKEFPVAAGNHTLQTLCSPWGKSGKLSFQIKEGEKIEFEATDPKSNSKVLLWMITTLLWGIVAFFFIVLSQIYWPTAKAFGFYQTSALFIISFFIYSHFHLKGKQTLFLQQKTTIAAT